MDFNPEELQNLLISDLGWDRTDVSEDLTPREAAKSALLGSIFKKWIPKDTTSLETVAVDGFLTSNAKCARVSLPTRSDELYDILETARSLMYSYFYSGSDQTHVLTLDDCLQLGRAGPGSSRKTRYTDFYQKMFGGPLSTTSVLLYRHYRNGISPRWLEAELLRSSRYQVDVIEGSSLSTVPKSNKTNRTICTEPSLNMFYQLGAGKIIEGLLQRFHNVDLSLQPDINKDLARRGSISGVMATIDLSSASDTISLALCRYLLPIATQRTLETLRSPVTRYKERDIDLEMISSMGNGFTFPLQTLIFATLVRATYMHSGITPRTGTNRNYSVFGDDIICLSSRFDNVVRSLEGCGFIVNREKSYGDGSFRESCGGDFFKGHDIRGVYLKGINHAADIYSAFNRLYRWSTKHNIDISSVLQYLKGLVDFRPIPWDAGDAEGIKCPRSALINPKFNRNGAIFYRPLVRVAKVRKIRETDSNFAPDGLVISSIGGYVRDKSITPRSDDVMFQVRKRWTPCWDSALPPGLTIRDLQLTWEYIS
jgi:hypothetical protein